MPSAAGRPGRRHSVLPGFGITLGYSLVYLSILVLIPIGAVFMKTADARVAELALFEGQNVRLVPSRLKVFQRPEPGQKVNAA